MLVIYQELWSRFVAPTGTNEPFSPSWCHQLGLKVSFQQPKGREAAAFGPGWWHQPGLKVAFVPVAVTNRDQCFVYITSTCEIFHSVRLPRPDGAARLPLCASPSPSSPCLRRRPAPPRRRRRPAPPASSSPVAAPLTSAPCLLVARRRAPHRRRRRPCLLVARGRSPHRRPRALPPRRSPPP